MIGTCVYEQLQALEIFLSASSGYVSYHSGQSVYFHLKNFIDSTLSFFRNSAGLRQNVSGLF